MWVHCGLVQPQLHCWVGLGIVWVPVPWLHLQEHKAYRETKEK